MIRLTLKCDHIWRELFVAASWHPVGKDPLAPLSASTPGQLSCLRSGFEWPDENKNGG